MRKKWPHTVWQLYFWGCVLLPLCGNNVSDSWHRGRQAQGLIINQAKRAQAPQVSLETFIPCKCCMVCVHLICMDMCDPFNITFSWHVEKPSVKILNKEKKIIYMNEGFKKVHTVNLSGTWEVPSWVCRHWKSYLKYHIFEFNLLLHLTVCIVTFYYFTYIFLGKFEARWLSSHRLDTTVEWVAKHLLISINKCIIWMYCTFVIVCWVLSQVLLSKIGHLKNMIQEPWLTSTSITSLTVQSKLHNGILWGSLWQQTADHTIS